MMRAGSGPHTNPEQRAHRKARDPIVKSAELHISDAVWLQLVQGWYSWETPVVGAAGSWE